MSTYAPSCCYLVLPKNFLSAQGLAQPFVLQPGCSQLDPGTQVFAEAVILGSNGKMTAFNPIVADVGMQTRVPIQPTVNPGDTIGIWFGANSDGVVLKPSDANDHDFKTCIQGDGTTNFG